MIKKSEKPLLPIKKKILKKGVIYARVATKKNNASISRQKKAAQNAAARDKVKIVKNVVEIISGSLRLDKRTTITDMLNKTKDKDIEKIYVESVRAISRDAGVAEEMYQQAKAKGVQIVPSDIPEVCVLDPNPVQTFMRRFMFAVTELENHLIVQQLQDGQQNKRNQLSQL